MKEYFVHYGAWTVLHLYILGIVYIQILLVISKNRFLNHLTEYDHETLEYYRHDFNGLFNQQYKDNESCPAFIEWLIWPIGLTIRILSACVNGGNYGTFSFSNYVTKFIRNLRL